ncbi:MAG: 50S ribosomal protein L23 [Flavobacteriales bacterium]|nr:50S ribosomal protein L23 [Flavobacteriales bacterium]
MNILRKPLLTEKMTKIADKTSQVGFIVEKTASKDEIKKAIEKAYNVEVERVNTVLVRGKRKSRFTKSGIVNGKKPNYKKAIIQLKEGQNIDFFENI